MLDKICAYAFGTVMGGIILYFFYALFLAWTGTWYGAIGAMLSMTLWQLIIVRAVYFIEK